MDKIELIAKPPDRNPEEVTNESVLDKLKTMAAEHEDGESPREPKESDKKVNDDYTMEHAQAEEVDHDGLPVPKGKIPIDSNFSTEEIKKLVELAKEETVIKDDIHVEVVNRDETFGDRVVISEEPEEDRIVGEK
ncbi:uncharacterized protein RJT20DRAFT_128072 [Scheffersomyces xylosifermentans]|uniref:uncharacterized protein n=1 Tax=Scheffersomyces xylosifermentans TaxID=1304137 RepID=UPI00315C5EA0